MMYICEIFRGVAGDLTEEVQLIDHFTNKKGMTSHCYRITYRSMERSLTDKEINELQIVWNHCEMDDGEESANRLGCSVCLLSLLCPNIISCVA
ncbi:phenylalanine--tRNA ligase, chloroplastic/mitochondrial-like [Helianthus annuus]|uniref:phenylalanine--tRNA ligase, chloroplastic/mitochondrial-like n=1 Tax=Helianthus annuus TaxID=4232 RepID=UPI0016532224|nr:phenylalanine--tRNA ligase, chloroplastic/mitochondrial-like [Helianthus annuus]